VAALERGRGGAQQGLERRRAAGSQELKRCWVAVFERVLGFLMGLELAWAATSRLEKSSRQLVG
jgi:hypothetical protein